MGEEDVVGGGAWVVVGWVVRVGGGGWLLDRGTAHVIDKVQHPVRDSKHLVEILSRTVFRSCI